MRTKSTAITELPSSPDADRRGRMIRYSVAMGIRMVCIVLCIVVPDWWRILPAVGAIALPYFAVVIANNVSGRNGGRVDRPGAVVPGTPPLRPSREPGEDAA